MTVADAVASLQGQPVAPQRTNAYAECLSRATPGARVVKSADISANLEFKADLRLDAAKTSRKVARLGTYLIAICPRIDADLSGLFNMQDRLAERKSG